MPPAPREMCPVSLNYPRAKRLGSRCPGAAQTGSPRCCALPPADFPLPSPCHTGWQDAAGAVRGSRLGSWKRCSPFKAGCHGVPPQLLRLAEPLPQHWRLLIAPRAHCCLQQQTQLSSSKAEGLGDHSGVRSPLPFPSRTGPSTCSDHTHELRAGSPSPLPSPTRHKQKQQNAGDEEEEEEERRESVGKSPRDLIRSGVGVPAGAERVAVAAQQRPASPPQPSPSLESKRSAFPSASSRHCKP